MWGKEPQSPLGTAVLTVQLKRDTKAGHSALSCVLMEDGVFLLLYETSRVQLRKLLLLLSILLLLGK